MVHSIACKHRRILLRYLVTDMKGLSSLTKHETQHISIKYTSQGRYITLSIRLNDISNYFISTPDTLHWPSSLITVSIDIQHRAPWISYLAFLFGKQTMHIFSIDSRACRTSK